MRILVVCGAGASSTFVAQRLRRAASDAGLDWDAAAGTETSVSDGHDLILVGPHLADRLEVLRESVTVPVIVLPDDVFADRDGTRTLALARSAISDAWNTPKGTP